MAGLFLVVAVLGLPHVPTVSTLMPNPEPRALASSGYIRSATRIGYVLRFDTEKCKLCETQSKRAPRLFIKGRDDGLGNTMEAIIYGMAIAKQLGMNFGGVVNGNHKSHRIDVAKAVAQVFGIEREEIFSHDIPSWDAEFQHLKDLQRLNGDYSRYGSGAKIYWSNDLPQHAIAKEPIETYLTPAFLAVLRGELIPKLSEKHPMSKLLGHDVNKPLVALHVRRGDVDDKTHKDRYTPNEWYYSLIDNVTQLMPEAEFHVWSSLIKDGRKTDEMRRLNKTWFDGFRQRGIPVHVDTSEEETWSYMARASILVMAKSSFSFIPAMLTESCVIYQPWLTRGLASFITGPASGLPLWDLQRCVNTAKQHIAN